MTPEALARLHAACFDCPPPWSAQAFADCLQDPAVILCTRSEGDTVVACALFRVVLDEAELLTLATAPEARRTGQARTLLNEGLAAARAKGACTCFLEVAADNAPALALYARAGFVVAGRRPGYYRIKGQPARDALILRAALM